MLSLKYALGQEDLHLLNDALHIRDTVFTREQGFDATIDRDEYDETALHVVMYDDDRPIAVLRAIPKNAQQLKVGRVALLADYRGKQLGRQLMTFIINYARAQHFEEVILSAQCTSQGFYRALGFQEEGEIYDEEGVDHIFMRYLL